MHFYKYQGTGNDFILLDNRGHNWQERLTQADIARLCDRRFGIGADGLILLSDPKASDFRMIYYNSDGNPSTMCGNGGRCLVAFAHRVGAIGEGECSFEAIDGLHRARLQADGQVELEMIRPQGWQQLSEQEFWLDTGSPHYVRFGVEDLAALDVDTEGRQIRHSEVFAAIGGTNVNFVDVRAENRLQVRTFERGVEAETLSCGTGVTACAYVHLRQQKRNERELTVSLDTPGGTLQVRVFDLMGPKEEVWLIGPATAVFEGNIDH